MDNNPTPTLQLPNEYCKIQPTDVSTKRYDIYLNYLIQQPHYYFEFLEILRSAGEEDEVYIHMNNNGGYVDTAMQIINYIKECKAEVTGCMEGACHSAASLILLSCDKVEVSAHGSMLCHYYTGGVYGKGHEIEAHVDFDKVYYKKFFKQIYSGFLTNKEMDTVINGKDIWLDSENILKRLKKRKK